MDIICQTFRGALFFLAVISLTFNASAEEEICEISQPVNEESRFEVALAEISNFLSSTNPQGRHTDTSEPLSRKVYRERISNLPKFEGENGGYQYAPTPQKYVPTNQFEPSVEYQFREYNPNKEYQQQYTQPEPSFKYPKPVAPEPPTLPGLPRDYKQPIKLKTQDVKPALRPAPKSETNEAEIPKYNDEDMKLSRNTKALLGKLPSGIGNVNSPAKKITIDRFTMPQDRQAEKDENFEDVDEEEEGATFEITMSDGKASEENYNLLGQALKALSVGQYESAVTLYKSVLKKQPKNRDALFGLATAYHKAGQKKQARNAYASLLVYHPKYMPGLNNLLVLASEEAPIDALKELSRLQKKNPNFSAIYAQKANIYMKLGENEKAIKNLAQALKLSPEDNAYKYNLAIMLDSVGNVEFSSKLYSELLQASYRGEQIPVGRKIIEDRLTHIAANSR